MRRTVFAAFTIIVVAIVGSLLWSGPAVTQSSVGGDNQFHLIAANSNNSTLIAPGEHSVHGVQLSSASNVTRAFLKFYDKVSAPTCGTDTPVKVLGIPTTSGPDNNVTIALGTAFHLGLGICVVTGIADSDNTAPASGTFNINIDWK